MSVERNRHITLHCQAQGVPTPTVVWKKATGKNSIILLHFDSISFPTYGTTCIEEFIKLFKCPHHFSL